jgi:para-aminobenzoate synthetase component 1
MNRYPLVEEVFTPLTAPELFELIKDRPYSFFLDSGMDTQRLGRYSFLGSEPFLVMNSRGSEITFIRGQEHKMQHGNPFDTIGKLLELYKLDYCPAPVPFVGGAVGYFSYDLCHFVEHLPSTAIDDLKLPECYFAFYDAIFAFDHLEGRAYLVATGFPELEERQRLKRARMRLEEMKNWLYPGHSVIEVSQSPEQNEEITLKANFTPEEYIKAVNRVREYIAAGDVFQVNLSQRFEADLEIPPYELYKRLRRVNPAPFASYLNFPGVAIVRGHEAETLLKTRDWLKS